MADVLYTISSDFPGGFNLNNFYKEIEADGTVPTTENIFLEGGENLTITFVSALSGPEQTALDAVVATHDPTPMEVSQESEPIQAGDILLDDNIIQPAVLNQDLIINGNGTGEAIINGVTLVTDGAGNNYLADDGTYKAVSSLSVGDLPAAKIRRTTQFNPLPVLPTWEDVDFDTTDVETDDSVIEHDDTNRDRLEAKESGLYLIYYNLNVDDECSARLRINDSTIIPGSEKSPGDKADTNQIVTQCSNLAITPLTAGQYVTLQVSADTTAEFMFAGATMVMIKLQGAKGDKGDPGTGTTIAIEDDGSLISSSVDTVNLGSGLVVTDNGSGKVTIDGAVTNVYGTEFHLFESNGVSTTTLTSFTNKISETTGTLPAGKYKLSISYNTNHDANGDSGIIELLVNGSAIGQDDEIHRYEPKDSGGTFGSTGTNQKYPHAKIYYFDVASPQTVPVILRFASQNGGVETSLWDTNIEIIRVQ